LDIADGTANDAAKIHTPQIVATVTRLVGFEETWRWKGFTVTLYRWMLSTATEYAARPNDIREKNANIPQSISPSCQVTDILIVNASKINNVK
jgi:hypothetical protein